MRYFLLILALFFVFFDANAQKKEQFRLKTVVIDAGHGGDDPGAVYGKLYEKDITLDIALKLGKKIKKSYPSIKVVYTRQTDVRVDVDKRGAIANRANGDVFISIHVNSTDDKVTKATGSETFTMGMHKNAASLAVAKKENSVITFEEGYEKTYQGFNPKDPESYIMFGLGQYSFSMSSIVLANAVEEYYVNNRKLPSRGVKQAGFLVLWHASMPSILTEVGFINNPKDRAYMSKPSGREELANALFRAFVKYKKSVEVESEYNTTQKRDDAEKIISAQNEEVVMAKYSSSKVGYAVQLLTSSKRVPINSTYFGNYSKNVFELKSGTRYKYFVGLMGSQEDAVRMQQKIRSGRSYKDCFVVGIKYGTTAPLAHVKLLLK